MPVPIGALTKFGGGGVKNGNMLPFSTVVQLGDHVPTTALVTWRLTHLMRLCGRTPPVESIGCVSAELPDAHCIVIHHSLISCLASTISGVKGPVSLSNPTLCSTPVWPQATLNALETMLLEIYLLVQVFELLSSQLSVRAA